MHPFKGPWWIIKLLPGASYELEFASNPSWKDKKHASNLFPYPLELILFQPLDGADSCYSQLYKQFGNAPYKEAGIDGFKLLQPFAVPAHFSCQGNFKDFYFPTLSELNDEFDPFPWVDDDEQIMLLNPMLLRQILLCTRVRRHPGQLYSLQAYHQ
jgi:hypothetical protein